jgi:hypothetical protein
MTDCERFTPRQRALLDDLESAGPAAATEAEVESLFEWLAVEDYRVRERAEDALRDLVYDPERRGAVASRLRPVLADGSATARLAAVRLAARVGSQDARLAHEEGLLEALLDCLDADDRELRAEAVSAVGLLAANAPDETADRGGVAALVTTLADDHPLVREEAAKHLGSVAPSGVDTLVDAGAIDALFDALDDEPAVRRNAAAALGRIALAEPEAIGRGGGAGPLLALLDDEQAVRREALRAVARLGASRPSSLAEASTVDRLSNALDHEDGVVRALGGAALLCLDDRVADDLRGRAGRAVRSSLDAGDESLWLLRVLPDVAAVRPAAVEPVVEAVRAVHDDAQGEAWRLAGAALENYEAGGR